MGILVFDIETIPDTAAYARLHQLENLEPSEIADAMFAQQRIKNGSSFLPIHQHKICAIGVLYHDEDRCWVGALGDADSSEAHLVQLFFQSIEKKHPTLVSWNGHAFDLPVLQYRALQHHIVSRAYWDNGDFNSQAKWKQYRGRFHSQHVDVMDEMALYQGRNSASLDTVAAYLGYPGKQGVSGKGVWESYLEGDIQGIRNYCETDVLNTYLVYLSFIQMQGRISAEEQAQYEARLKQTLQKDHLEHLNTFMQHWEEKSGLKVG